MIGCQLYHARRSRGWTPSLLTNLVETWPFEEASGNATGSFAGTVLTASGGPTRTTGSHGGGASLASASSQEFRINNSATMKWGGGDFSVSFWVNYATIPSFPPGVSTYASIDHTTTFQLSQGGPRGGNDIQFSVGNAVASAVSSATKGPAPSTGVWYHVVGLYTTATKKASIYVNGVIGTDGAALPSDPTTSNVDFAIGGSLGLGFYTNGIVDEVKKWSRLLTIAEIAQLYGNGYPPTYPRG